MRKAAVIFATCFGAGYAPLAPGTAGAAVGLIPVFLLARWPFLYCAATAVLFFAGVASSSVAEEEFGEKDSPRIVIDEAVSMLITFAGMPLTGFAVAGGFVLNRLLDIFKPFPAGRLQKLGGGWGVMLDDLASAIYSNIFLRITIALFFK